MTADRLAQIELAYQDARERRGEDQSRFLDEFRGADRLLRLHVETLLRQDASADTLLDRPAIEAVLESTTPNFSGTRIGVYEILEPIGSGGMGEVYRARDTRLHREAAMKFLGGHLAGDPEWLAYFRREAQTLAALSHPNVAQVYGLEESGTTTAIAMELVEGETLAERLRRGPIDAANAVRVAREIAEALEAAHEKGIAHRDLKPANVKLTPQGQVKVFDFGLAKTFPSPGAATASTSAPSDANPATAAGTVLGTRGYMSPEQGSGAPTDHRTDVFSFGCVLFEMLTGTRAFDGKTLPDERSVLDVEGLLSKLPRDLSPKIPNLIARCVERDRRRRWQAIGDVRIELEAIETGPHGLQVHAPSQGKPLWTRALPLIATAIVTGLVVAGLVRGPAVPPQHTTRFSVDLAPGQRFTEHGRRVINVSPDGSHVAFVANDQLLVRDMADSTPHTLPVVGWDLSDPLFSPDGRWIVYFAERKLQKIATSGGTPLVIADTTDSPAPAELFGVSWGSDNHIFLGRGRRGIQRVSAHGGELETVLTVNAGEVAYGPQLLDGEHLLFTLASDDAGSERWNQAQIVVQSLKSGIRKIVLKNCSDARYIASSGHIIYAQGSTLWAITFDANALRVVGEPTAIVEEVRRANVDGATGAAQFGVSATGTLAFIRGGIPETSRSLALIDMTGETTVLDVLPGLNHTPRFSSDGRQIAWRGGDGNIWIYDRSGTRAKRKLTFDGRSSAPVWTADGRIVFKSGRDGDCGLFWQRADGSAPADCLLKSERGFSDVPTSVSPDGKTLLFLRASVPKHDRSEGSEPDGIWMLPFDGTRAPQRLVAAGRTESRYGSATFSPDGKWIVYQARPGSSIYVEPFPPTGARYHVTSEPNWAPMWSPDGARLTFLTGPTRSRFRAVDILSRDGSFAFGPVRDLFDVKVPVNTFGEGGRVVDMSPDGKYFAAMQDSFETQSDRPSKIGVVLGWDADLRTARFRFK